MYIFSTRKNSIANTEIQFAVLTTNIGLLTKSGIRHQALLLSHYIADRIAPKTQYVVISFHITIVEIHIAMVT